MNLEKYTQKSIEAIKAASLMAEENGNQYITDKHLLYALLDQDGGLIPSIFKNMGADPDSLLSKLNTLIEKLPKVNGSNVQIGRAHV